MHRQEFAAGLLGQGYTVVVCQNCGAGFADGIPTQAEMDHYYAERSKYSETDSGGSESDYDRRRFGLIADQITPHLPSKDVAMLDIGCATGGLLAVLRQRGFGPVLGADPSPACGATARRLHGVEVRTATIRDLAGWRDRFDVVFMIGVLEHLRDVAEAVRIAVGLLRPGGRLFVAVPDVTGLAASRNAPYQQFSMEHVNFFSRDSLHRLMAGSGLAPRQVWQDMIEWRENVTEPVLAVLYENAAEVSGVERDQLTEPALGRYVEASRRADAAILDRIDALVASGESILVWGAGALTRRLLASSRLGQASIVAFVDSSPHLQGALLAGRPVWPPDRLAGRTEAILVCSVAFEREIIRLIRDQLGLPNPVRTLTAAGLE